MRPASGLPPRFDAFDPVVRENPYPVYAKLREAGPVCRGGAGHWVVPRYDDVAALLRDNRLSKHLPAEYYQASAGTGPAASFLHRINLGRRNRAIARIMARVFGSGFISADRIAEIAGQLLDSALDRGTFDAVTDLGFPLPGMVMCQILGVPAGDRDQVWRRAAALAGALGNTILLSPSDRAAADDAVQWLRGYLGDLVADRRNGAGQDLLSRMLAAEDAGSRLTIDEIIDNAIVVFHAGFETTSGMISNGCAALLRNPGELARLRADRSLIPTAVDEFLRYDAPIQVTMRLAEEPIAIGDRVIRKGRVIILLLGSANHDEAKFSRPEQLDVGRDPNPHLSFGGGIYYCLASALAKAQGEAAFRLLLERCAELQVAGQPVRSPRFNFRSYASVPVTAEPAAWHPAGR
ncbi:MAG: cytochrome P450 [Streptosporangiaceae bacterium]